METLNQEQISGRPLFLVSAFKTAVKRPLPFRGCGKRHLGQQQLAGRRDHSALIVSAFNSTLLWTRRFYLFTTSGPLGSHVQKLSGRLLKGVGERGYHIWHHYCLTSDSISLSAPSPHPPPPQSDITHSTSNARHAANLADRNVVSVPRFLFLHASAISYTSYRRRHESKSIVELESFDLQ